MSSNPNITWDDISDNNELGWSWNSISKNKFTYQKNLIREEINKKWMSAYKIQCAFRKYRYNPKYKFCQKIQMDYFKSFLELKKII